MKDLQNKTMEAVYDDCQILDNIPNTLDVEFIFQSTAGILNLLRNLATSHWTLVLLLDNNMLFTQELMNGVMDRNGQIGLSVIFEMATWSVWTLPPSQKPIITMSR